MPNKIEILENTLLKLLIRRGTDGDRKQITLTEGELGYTTDTKRVFIGDGSTPGGVLVGNKFAGLNSDLTLLAPGDIGDLAFNTDNNSIYIIEENDGSLPTDWKRIAKEYTAGDSTVNITGDGVISVNKLSAGNLSDDMLGESLELDGNDRVALKSSINIDDVTIRSGTHLNLPKDLNIGGIEYEFPQTVPGVAEVLTAVTATTLDWVELPDSNVYAANSTITVFPGNQISVGQIGASNLSIGLAGESLELDGGNALALKSEITVDRISRRDPDINAYLKLPQKLEINGKKYNFPGGSPVKGDVLTVHSAGNLEWLQPKSILTVVPATTATVIPIGTIVPFVETDANIPVGWLPCDGRSVSTTVYSDLFDIIGVQYGNTGGAGTFDLPDYTDKVLYSSADPVNSTLYDIDTGTSGSLTGTGALYIIRARETHLFTTPSMTITSPLTAQINGVDVTNSPFNPLSGDIIIGTKQEDIRTIIKEYIDETPPGLQSFTSSGNFETKKRYTKFYITGSGAYGGNYRTGGAAGTCVGYLDLPIGTTIQAVVGAPPAVNGSGNFSKIKIGGADIARSDGALKNSRNANSGTISADPRVTSSYIIPGGAGNVDTNNGGYEESEGASSFWGSIPAPGAGGQGHGGGQNNCIYQPVGGIIMFEW